MFVVARGVMLNELLALVSRGIRIIRATRACAKYFGVELLDIGKENFSGKYSPAPKTTENKPRVTRYASYLKEPSTRPKDICRKAVPMKIANIILTSSHVLSR